MRLALFQERREALAKVCRGANASVRVNSYLQLAVKLLLAEVSEQALGVPETGRTDFEQRSRQLLRTRHQPLRRHDLVDQTYLPRLFCVEESPTQQQVAGSLFADLADQEDRNQRRYEADAGFGVAEFGPGDSKCVIADRGNAAAAGDRRPIDRRNHGFRKTVNPPEHAGCATRVSEMSLGGVRQSVLWPLALKQTVP